MAGHPTPWIEVGKPLDEPATRAYDYGAAEPGGAHLFGFE
jgi:hypothetical protein